MLLLLYHISFSIMSDGKFKTICNARIKINDNASKP